MDIVSCTFDLKTAKKLIKDGRIEEGLSALQDALRRGCLSPQELIQAGLIVSKSIDRLRPPQSISLHVFAQCTTHWLANAVCAVAWGEGHPTKVSEALYDNVIQELANIHPSEDPTVVVLLPWSQRLLRADRNEIDAAIDAEIELWNRAWQIAVDKGISRIIQVGYDWVRPGPAGYHRSAQRGGDVNIIGEINARLKATLPADAYFLPLDQISGIVGRSSFYDMRQYYWTKQPFSEQGTVSLSRHIFAASRALITGPRKVLVLDLDNTLWGGVIGEIGSSAIRLGEGPDGEAFTEFQVYLKALSKKGILLAVASKNNPDDAREAFCQNTNMVLSLDDFVAFEANWQPKAESLRKISSELRLGLDSFVFFDDNKAEQEHIRQALPSVAVVDVPDEPAQFVDALQESLWFEAMITTAEDEQRTSHYVSDRKRKLVMEQASSVDDYLASLEMHAEIRPIDESDITRVVQLLGKTNQFNLTTRRHGIEDVRKILSTEHSLGYSLRLSDRFGDHGLVGLLLAVPVSNTEGEFSKNLRIDSLLMSCRVIGRTAEHALLNFLIAEARRVGFASLRGEYIPSAKNMLVQSFYPSLGFTRIPSEIARDSSIVEYELGIIGATAFKTFVRT